MPVNTNEHTGMRLFAMALCSVPIALAGAIVSMACEPDPIGAIEVQPVMVICAEEEVVIGWWTDYAKAGRIQFIQGGQVVREHLIPDPELVGGSMLDAPEVTTTYLLQAKGEGGSWVDLGSEEVMVVVGSNLQYDIHATGVSNGEDPLDCQWLAELTELEISPDVRVNTLTNINPITIDVEHGGYGKESYLQSLMVTSFFSNQPVIGTWSFLPSTPDDARDLLQTYGAQECQGLPLEARVTLQCAQP